MKILQQPVKVRRGERVQITFSRPANVYIMTEPNFKRYKEGASFRRIGGFFEQSPAELTAPYDGVWHAIIEKGAHVNPKPITGSVAILPPLKKEVPYFKPDVIENSVEENVSTEDDSSEVENQDTEEDDKNN